MRVIIVRHGETEENVAGIIQGQTQGTLTAKGLEQAHKVAKRLEHEPIEKAFVSDLKRAVDTAHEILKHHPSAQVVYEPALREHTLGPLDGQPSEKFKEAQAVFGADYVPEGGESWDDFKKRVITFYHRVLEREKSNCILLVSHGGPITHILLHLLNKAHDEYATYHPENTAVTIFDVEMPSKKHTTHALNCTKHLAEEA